MSLTTSRDCSAARAYGIAYMFVVGPPLMKLSLALYSRKGLSSQTTLHSVGNVNVFHLFTRPYDLIELRFGSFVR